MPLIFSLLLGLVLGSFLNALIWRLKNNRSIWRGRSICPACGKKLRPIELVPIISFVFQKGRCRSCLGKISWMYPLVELGLALLFLLVTYFRLGTDLSGAVNLSQLIIWLRDLFLVTILLGIFVFDLRYSLIPDQFSLPGIAIILVINWWLGLELDLLLLAVLVGFGFFFLQYAVSKGQWVGSGDIRLGALMGAALSWPLILVALFLAYLVGSVWAVVLIWLGKKGWKSQLPFGTFLAASTVFTLYWGEPLLKWYLSLIGY